MEKITINNQEFEKITVFGLGINPNWVYYKGSWYEQVAEPVVKPQPVNNFKEGDWVTDDECKNLYLYSHCEGECHYAKAFGGISFGKLLRKCTEEEIHNHLKKEAIKKGFIKGAKIKSLFGSETVLNNDLSYYHFNYDEFILNGYLVYRKGTWAKLIPHLFITEDGVKIYNNDWVFWVTLGKGSTQIKSTYWDKDTNKTYDANKYFSTKEAAEKYIEENSYFTHNQLINGQYYTTYHFKDKYTFKFEYDLWYNHLNKEVINAKGNFFPDNGFKKFYPATKEEIQFLEENKSKFTFGEHDCSFKLISRDTAAQQLGYLGHVEVTCKGVIGTDFQIGEILKNYFKPCKFGNVEVKSFTFKESLRGGAQYIVNEENKIDKITIGCLTGTYKELQDIYNHCLTLLK